MPKTARPQHRLTREIPSPLTPWLKTLVKEKMNWTVLLGRDDKFDYEVERKRKSSRARKKRGHEGDKDHYLPRPARQVLSPSFYADTAKEPVQKRLMATGTPSHAARATHLFLLPLQVCRTTRCVCYLGRSAVGTAEIDVHFLMGKQPKSAQVASASQTRGPTTKSGLQPPAGILL